MMKNKPLQRGDSLTVDDATINFITIQTSDNSPHTPTGSSNDAFSPSVGDAISPSVGKLGLSSEVVKEMDDSDENEDHELL